MKLYWIIIFILLSTTVSGQEIILENKTIEITIIINNQTCNDTTNVFRLENLNYSTGDNSTIINYTQIWNNQTIEISKEIKKYSQTNTGNITNIKNGENILKFQIENKTFEWIIKTNCSIKTTNLTENKSMLDKNETINKTITNSTNQTTTPLNETEKEDQEPKNKLIIEMNKNIFSVGEKIKFKFVNNTQPITYWIENSKGEKIKEEYTTTNDNEKTYTFKDQEETEKIYFLIAKTEDEIIKKIIGVVKTIEENEESKIEIKKALSNEHNIYLEVEIFRGDTKKTTIYCYAKTKDKKSSEDTKIKIDKEKEKITISTSIYPKGEWSEKTTIICEGLDLKEEIEVNTPKKEEQKEKTKEEDSEKKEEQKEEKTKEKEEEKAEKKEVNLSTIIEEKPQMITGKTSAYSNSSKKEKTTTSITITALISMFFGSLVSYGPKKFIDKFIKK